MDRGVQWQPDFSREAATFDLTGMRHDVCGRVAIYFSTEFIMHPTRKPMVWSMFMPDGSEPKAGVPIMCPHCGGTLVLAPPSLSVDRGPDRRESAVQDMALKLASIVLNGART